MCGGPSGSSGIIVKLSTNHFRLTSRPQWALYQYHIDYNPLMEARRLRSALLFQHEDLIGRCHAFDGTILFLPKRLQHKVISNVPTGRGVGGVHLKAKLRKGLLAGDIGHLEVLYDSLCPWSQAEGLWRVI